MEKNNFKRLEEEMESKFASSADKIKDNINGQRGIWTLIGDLFELYIPKVFNALLGGVSYNTGVVDRQDQADSKEIEE